ncbi:MAG: FkbM family methyltransferase [Desulfobacca sp.]|nr:FkbM family methyltransferase [Desulfobacca sp.]
MLRCLGHQEWLSVELRRRIIKKFVNHNTVGSQKFEIDFFGLRYRGNLTELIDWFVYFFGAYEKQELFLLRDLVSAKPEPVFLDIGASVGQHSLFMSQFCAQVHAFEPYARARERLQEKIALNQLQNIMVHSVGLGAHNEDLEFYAPVGHNIGVGSFLAHHRHKHQPIGKLRVVNGDDYLSGLALPRLDLIKIDVEGFEAYVLSGLSSTLKRFRPLLVMELTNYNAKNGSLVQEIKDLLPREYAIQQVSYNNFWSLTNRKLYKLRGLKVYESSILPRNINLVLMPG